MPCCVGTSGRNLGLQGRSGQGKGVEEGQPSGRGLRKTSTWQMHELPTEARREAANHTTSPMRPLCAGTKQEAALTWCRKRPWWAAQEWAGSSFRWVWVMRTSTLSEADELDSRLLRSRTHLLLEGAFAGAQLAALGDLVVLERGAHCGGEGCAGEEAGWERSSCLLCPPGSHDTRCHRNRQLLHRGGHPIWQPASATLPRAGAPVSPAVSQASWQPSRSTGTRLWLGWEVSGNMVG